MRLKRTSAKYSTVQDCFNNTSATVMRVMYSLKLAVCQRTTVAFDGLYLVSKPFPVVTGPLNPVYTVCKHASQPRDSQS